MEKLEGSLLSLDLMLLCTPCACAAPPPGKASHWEGDLGVQFSSCRVNALHTLVREGLRLKPGVLSVADSHSATRVLMDVNQLFLTGIHPSQERAPADQTKDFVNQ